jgi:hypothetical protein
MVKVELAGIALSSGEATLRPLPVLETTISEITTQTAGKLFVGIKGIEAGEIVLGLSVNGQPLEIFQNEKQGGTMITVSPPGKYEPYAIDLPMRIIGPETQQFPAEHLIEVFWGVLDEIRHGWKGSAKFVLRLTGISPVPKKYNPKTDSD